MATKLKARDLHESIRLLRRFTFDVACAILENGCMGRSEAMKQSHLVRELLGALGRGEVRFVYEKEDGTRREARGTLCHGISEAFDNYEYKMDLTGTCYDTLLRFTYWDLDREAFRSFATERVKEIIEVRIPYNV